MCRMGLSEMRPRSFAVGSPSCHATHPWASSWNVIDSEEDRQEEKKGLDVPRHGGRRVHQRARVWQDAPHQRCLIRPPSRPRPTPATLARALGDPTRVGDPARPRGGGALRRRARAGARRVAAQGLEPPRRPARGRADREPARAPHGAQRARRARASRRSSRGSRRRSGGRCTRGERRRPCGRPAAARVADVQVDAPARAAGAPGRRSIARPARASSSSSCSAAASTACRSRTCARSCATRRRARCRGRGRACSGWCRCTAACSTSSTCAARSGWPADAEPRELVVVEHDGRSRRDAGRGDPPGRERRARRAARAARRERRGGGRRGPRRPAGARAAAEAVVGPAA